MEKAEWPGKAICESCGINADLHFCSTLPNDPRVSWNKILCMDCLEQRNTDESEVGE